MNWEDECYLLSKSKFRENANIINVFLLKEGKYLVLFMGKFKKNKKFPSII